MTFTSKIRQGSSTPASPAEDLPRSPTVDWVVPKGAVGMLYKQVDAQLRRRKRKRITAAATCCALLLVGAWVWQGRHPVESAVKPMASPIVSVPAKQILPDGSVIELNGATVKVDFTGALRRVILQQGEAHFQVAKHSKPFVVTAGGVEVRAVGTAFAVQLGAKQVDVIVTEGIVAVDRTEKSDRSDVLPESSDPRTGTTVSAGNRVVVDIVPESAAARGSAVQPVTPAELTERLAWRVPRVEFSSTPLSQAIPIFREHARVRILLADPEIGQLEVSGVLRADNVDSLLRVLEAEFRIRAERQGDQVVLRR